MSTIKTYRDLLVWQRAMELAKAVYLATQTFPKVEQFGLTNQLRRSVVSIASNIAEGNGRGSPQDYVRFLHISRGSLFEAQTQIELAHRLAYLTAAESTPLLSLCNEIERMLNTILTKLQAPLR